MPMYEFECKKCETVYSKIISFSNLDDKKAMRKVKCPKCKSSSKTKLISMPNFSFAQPEGTDRYNNSHDYRFYHSHEKPGGVREQRKTAEALSHMGSNPYGDTSGTDIELDTGIHDVHERPGLS